MNKYNGKKKNKNKNNFLLIGLLIAVLAVSFIIKENFSKQESLSNENTPQVSQGEGIKILKSELTDQAKFYPYEIDGIQLEVLAFKASDNTIRTALNTCQVCYDSGRGYYVQEGDVLVCQNCGNRFAADQVEVIKGGCNPVPIMKENKTDDGTNITISETFLLENLYLFENWK